MTAGMSAGGFIGKAGVFLRVADGFDFLTFFELVFFEVVFFALVFGDVLCTVVVAGAARAGRNGTATDNRANPTGVIQLRFMVNSIRVAFLGPLVGDAKAVTESIFQPRHACELVGSLTVAAQCSSRTHALVSTLGRC